MIDIMLHQSSYISQVVEAIIAGDFNYDLLNVSENKLLDIFADHVQMANKPMEKEVMTMNFQIVKKSDNKQISSINRYIDYSLSVPSPLVCNLTNYETVQLHHVNYFITIPYLE